MKFSASSTISFLALLALTFMSNGAVADARLLVGDDEDEHGCKPSTGYTWCESTGTCERAADCSSDGVVGDDTDENGCKASAGFSWCESKLSCQRASDCPTEDVVGDDEDEHGCKPSTGYTWCETTESCERNCPSEPSDNDDEPSDNDDEPSDNDDEPHHHDDDDHHHNDDSSATSNKNAIRIAAGLLASSLAFPLL